MTIRPTSEAPSEGARAANIDDAVSPIDQRRWLRFFAFNGYVFVVVAVVFWVILPGFPPWSPAMTATETANFFAEHRTVLLAAAAAWQVSMQAMLLWQLALARYMWRMEGGSRTLTLGALVSGLTVPFLMMIAGAALAVAAYKPLADPGATRSFADFFYWIADIFWPPVSCQMFFVGWLIHRTQNRPNALPRYTVWLSMLAAFTMPLLWTPFYSDQGVWAANGAVGYMIPMATWCLWVLGVTPTLHREIGRLPSL
jgi:hypothetical protein